MPCTFFAAPFDVRLRSAAEGDTVVQPDLCVICDVGKIDERGCQGAPDLVVEILSPSTSGKDLNEKHDLYQANGIQEYWVLHPAEMTALIYTLNGTAHYQPSRLYSHREKLASHVFPGLSVELGEVFD